MPHAWLGKGNGPRDSNEISQRPSELVGKRVPRFFLRKVCSGRRRRLKIHASFGRKRAPERLRRVVGEKRS
jgi:hypothetical protein